MTRAATWYCRVAICCLVASVIVVVEATSAAGPGIQGSSPVPPAHQVGTQAVVAAAGPYAAAAGARILAQGGNVIDAAVATAAALNVTEGYASGIGGGGFLLAHRADTGANLALDCRETAPSAATVDYFVIPGSSPPVPWPKPQLSSGGISVGVPGSVACWNTALQLWGTMPLGAVLQPAIELAANGFQVYPYYQSEIIGQASRLLLFPESQAQWLPNRTPLPVGAVLRQQDLARTLQNIATVGPAYVYGTLAPTIAAAVNSPPWTPTPGVTVIPGRMSAQDINSYQVLQHAPLSTQYRGYTVVSHSAPSSGVTMLETLNILQNYNFQNCVTPVTTPNTSCLGPDNPTSIHLINEAFRLAGGDRLRWLADPRREFQTTPVPCIGLLNPSYAASRQALINPNAAQPNLFNGNPLPFNPPNFGGCEPLTPTPGPLAPQRARAGDLPAAVARTLALGHPVGPGAAQAPARDDTSTTHLVVSDSAGNAVSYTTTLAQHFGSAMLVPGTGILLNNTLTDFDPVPGNASQSPNNVVGPGKRPWGTEAPTMIFNQQGQLLWVYGVAGGPWITPSVVELTIDFVDWGMDPQTAINRWRFLPEPISLAGPEIAIEATVAPTVPPVPGQPTATPALTPAVSQTMITALQTMGHPIVLGTPGSGGQAIARNPTTGALVAAADPRRQGATAIATFPPPLPTATIHPLTATILALTASPTPQPTLHPATQTAIAQTATVLALTPTATHLPATQTIIALTATATHLPATQTVIALTPTQTPTIHPLTATAIAQTATIQALTATATHLPATQTVIALTRTPTPVLAPTTPPNAPITSGTPGVPAATQVGQVIQYGGQVSGTWRKTGSGAFVFTASSPNPAIVPGSIPSLTLPTTAGNESGIPLAGQPAVCSPVGAGPPFTTTCQGTTVGDVLLGAQVTVTFALVGGGTTTSTGQQVVGAAANILPPAPAPSQAPGATLPLLPPPPPIFLPPPPSPPLPAPPASMLSPSLGPPAVGVPVIPEADSFWLLMLGLAGFAALRLRCRGGSL